MANSDCKEILNLIPLYMDKMLSEEETDIVSRHLETCKNCADELRFITSISKSVANIPHVEAPRDLSKKIIQKAKDRQIKKRARQTVILRLASTCIATAAVIALCVVNIPKTADIHKTPTAESHATPSAHIAQPPVSITAPVAEDATEAPKPKTTEKIAPKASEPPIETDSENSIAAHTECDPGAAVALCDDDSFIVASVTIPEDVRPAALEILSSCPQDETGYKAQDISTILQKLSELGATIETTSDTSVTDNYIIIK